MSIAPTPDRDQGRAFPSLTDEELNFTPDQTASYCTLVRKRLGTPRLPQSFILRPLFGLRRIGRGERL
jgi:hypothetical protein